MRLFMDFVFGLGQVLVRTLWVKSVGSAHWLVRQWVISVTELSLDLKSRQVTKIRLEPSLLLEIRTLISPRQWKTNMWKDFFVHFGCRRIWSSLFWASSARITWVFHELQYPGHFRLDSNLGQSVYGLINHGRPAWRVCALAEGWYYKKSLFVSLLPNIYGKMSFPGQQGDVDEVQ